MPEASHRRIGILLVVFHLVIGESYYHAYRKNWREKSCSSVIDNIKNQRLEVPMPPNIRGKWTSTRCEVRPGPEFVLRKYLFKRNKFYIYQYYYSDPGCSRPLYGIVADGTYKLLQASWIVPGGMEAKYHLRNVSVIPYNVHATELFRKQKSYNCERLKNINWKIKKPHQILNFPSYKRYRKLRQMSNDFDCTRSFNFTLHELQLIRLEIRYYKKINRRIHKHYSYSHKDRTKVVKELYLGDLHTETNQRHTHRPTSYQEALKPAKTRRCRVCRKIFSSDVYHPPTLNKYKTSIFDLPGEWESIKCETRQYGQFLIRRLSFLPDEKSWQGQYNFFKDPSCSEPTFSLDVKGSYVKDGNADLIPGAKEFNFRITRLKVTPKNKQTTDSLNYFNGNECGIPKSWRMNVQQDVTSTGGCLTLGVTLPNVEFEIVKTEINNRRMYLYIGKRPSDGNTMRTPGRRPTAFQSPLVKCKSPGIDSNNVVISRYQKLQQQADIPVNGFYLIKSNTLLLSVLMLMLLLGNI